MLKDVVSKLDYSHFDQIAVVIFAVCFVGIVLGALWLRPDASRKFSEIPLTDAVVDPRSKAKTQ